MQSSTRCLKIIILFCNVSEIFVRSINFVVFVLFKDSAVKVSVWRRFYCSQKMFVDFVETAFICLSSLVTVQDTHCFFLNLQIRRPQHHELYTIKIIAKFRLSKKILIQDFAKLRKFWSRLHFYHFGTLPLILLKWEQPQKWKRQRQPKWDCGLVLETKIIFWLLIRNVEVACFDIHCLTFVSWENGEDKKTKTVRLHHQHCTNRIHLRYLERIFLCERIFFARWRLESQTSITFPRHQEKL